jgi:hypothetical protein
VNGRVLDRLVHVGTYSCPLYAGRPGCNTQPYFIFNLANRGNVPCVRTLEVDQSDITLNVCLL